MSIMRLEIPALADGEELGLRAAKPRTGHRESIRDWSHAGIRTKMISKPRCAGEARIAPLLRSSCVVGGSPKRRYGLKRFGVERVEIHAKVASVRRRIRLVAHPQAFNRIGAGPIGAFGPSTRCVRRSLRPRHG